MYGLIIGFGSIGKRHAYHLTQLGFQVTFVSSQQVEYYFRYPTISEAFESCHFDLVIIANSTFMHYVSLEQIIRCGYKGVVLVEKPLYSQVEILPNNVATKNIFIGYNLRFSQLLLSVKEILQNEEVLSFSAHVGQYLPTWRSGVDYRKSYSAQKQAGGGVLRDLSHELDYCLWLCGSCIDVCALGGQYSTLEITSEDIFSILMRCQSCPVINLHLNYLNRTPRRELLIQTVQHTVLVDLIKGNLIRNGEVILQVSNDVENTYRRQLEAIIAGSFEQLCSYSEGLKVVKLIHAIEESNYSKKWIAL